MELQQAWSGSINKHILESVLMQQSIIINIKSFIITILLAIIVLIIAVQTIIIVYTVESTRCLKFTSRLEMLTLACHRL